MASNLWEYYSGQGQSMPSLSSRSQLYAQYGLGDAKGYRGTAAQNTALLNALQGGGGSTAPAPVAGGGGNASPAPNYGSYNDVINTLSGQQGQLGAIYDPQVSVLQNSLPTIQKKYSDMLAQLNTQTEQQTGRLNTQQVADVGNEQIRQANAGVAEAYGTPEMAAQQAIKTKYAQAISDLLSQADTQRKGYGIQQAQEENQVQQTIASLLGQKAQASMDIQNKIAEAKANALKEQESKRQFEEQMKLEREKAAKSASSSSTDKTEKLMGTFYDELYNPKTKVAATASAEEDMGAGNFQRREQLISYLQGKYGNYIEPKDIAAMVYDTYRDH